MTPFHYTILCDRKNPLLHVCTLCIFIFAFKITTEIICLQDELPMVLITSLDLETFIKGHHVYKDSRAMMCTKIYGHQNKANN